MPSGEVRLWARAVQVSLPAGGGLVGGGGGMNERKPARIEEEGERLDRGEASSGLL
jgi:hypothetical protein